MNIKPVVTEFNVPPPFNVARQGERVSADREERVPSQRRTNITLSPSHSLAVFLSSGRVSPDMEKNLADNMKRGMKLQFVGRHLTSGVGSGEGWTERASAPVILGSKGEKPQGGMGQQTVSLPHLDKTSSPQRPSLTNRRYQKVASRLRSRFNLDIKDYLRPGSLGLLSSERVSMPNISPNRVVEVIEEHPKGLERPSTDARLSHKSLEQNTAFQGPEPGKGVLSGGRDQHFFLPNESVSLVRDLNFNGIINFSDALSRLQAMQAVNNGLEDDEINDVMDFFYPDDTEVNAPTLQPTADDDKKAEALKKFFLLADQRNIFFDDALIACLFRHREDKYKVTNEVTKTKPEDLRKIFHDLTKFTEDDCRLVQELFLQGPQGYDPRHQAAVVIRYDSSTK